MSPIPLAEEGVFIRPVNLNVADGAIGVAGIVDIVETRGSRSDSSSVCVWNAGCIRVAFETEELYGVACQQFRVCRSMRRVACLTAFDFERGVLVNEWTLFIGVTL